MSSNRVLSVLALVAGLAAPLPALAQATPATTVAPSPAPMQGNAHRHHRHHKSLLHALDAVNLTDAQKQQVAAFRDQEQKANLNADAATKRANAASMRKQIMGILTPDQKAELAAEMHHQQTPHPMSSPNPTASPGA